MTYLRIAAQEAFASPQRSQNYYVSESMGIACGLFISARTGWFMAECQ
jgi:hypothetical protein